MQEGVGGLLRNKTRPLRIPPLAPEITGQVVALTLGPPTGEVTHWTTAAMASVIGISVSSVQRIWRAHDLQPHPDKIIAAVRREHQTLDLLH